MKKIVKFSFSLLILTISVTTYGQEKILFNPRISHFLTNKGSMIPSSYDVESVRLSINYNNRLLILPEIRDVFFDAVIKYDNHLIGARVFSDQQSLSFTKDKFSFIYGYVIKTGNSSSLTMGTQVGYAAIRFASSEADAGGSDGSLDLSLSSSFKYEGFEIGVALQQLQNSELQPITDKFKINRYFESFISYTVDLDKEIEYELGFTIQKNDVLFLWRTNHIFSFDKKYGFMLALGDGNYYSVGGFVQLNGDLPLKIAASYNDFYGSQNFKKSTGTLQVNYAF